MHAVGITLLTLSLALAGCHQPDGDQAPAPRFLDGTLGAWPHPNTPQLLLGAAGEAPVALIPGSSPDALAVFPEPGLPSQQVELAGLPSIRAVLPTRQGAMAVGYRSLLPLGLDGRPTDEPRALDPSAKQGLAWTTFAGGLANVSLDTGEEDSLTVQRLDLEGGLTGTTELATQRRVRSPGLAALSEDLLLVVWVSTGVPVVISDPSTEPPSAHVPNPAMTPEQENALREDALTIALVDAQGALVAEPRDIYQPGLGGALYSCAVQARPGGGALLAWGDSTPGPWSVYAMVIDAQGQPRQPGRINRGERKDALDIALPVGGEGRWVSWGSGIHWGMFERSGVGRVALRQLVPGEPVLSFAADGSVESHAVALTTRGTLVVAGVEKDGSYSVRTGFFPHTPESP